MANAASECATADGETNDREKISGAITNPFFSHCAGRSRRMAFTGASLSADDADKAQMSSASHLRNLRITIPAVISLEPELTALPDTGVLIARERRDAVSIYPELRILTWAGVMLISTGVGVYITKHLDDIGPLAIATVVGLAAAACYAWAYWKRSRTASLADDYVLLLAALLASADIGYIEHHYRLLGNSWPRHFLFLAILHAATAYFFRSRLVLSLSVASLAAWLGIERRSVDAIFESAIETSLRAFLCAAIVVAWRAVDRKLRPASTFSSLFDHAAANLAFWASLILAAHDETRLTGCLIAIALAAASMIYGQRTREGTFVIYAWVYGTIAVDIAICNAIRDEIFITFYLLVSTIAAIVGLFLTHARLRRTA
ncbi:MAG: DUF2157 domain-containing protein [Actinobacteria bacterium]|nr:MAG: DUF2157 domain-containing protein [Actinomycetota bacterium]